MNNIRCGFVISFNGPYYSNFVASIVALEKNMQKSNIETVYIFPSESENFEWMQKLKELNDNIYFIDYNPHSFDNYKKIKNIFREEKVNLIYSRMSGWDFVAHFAFPKLPVIWHMDMNVNVVNWKRRILNWIRFRIFAFGRTYLIGPSVTVTDAVNSLHPKNECIPIINSIDFDRLILKGEHKLPEQKKLLIFAWHPQIKGLDTTLDALEKVNDRDVKYKLVISAQPLTYDYMAERYCKNIPEWIDILPPTDDVSSLYNSCDIMISASTSESFSFCLAEAIYSGLPVVFSNIDGTSWAREFKNAYEFKVSDVDDLIRCLDNVSQNINRDDIEFNRKIIDEKYSMDSWAKEIVSFVKSI